VTRNDDDDDDDDDDNNNNVLKVLSLVKQNVIQ
jgi:hypothetical protein